MIRTLRRIGGRELVAEVAREATPGVEAALRATAAAGTTPEGQAWAPTQKGGRAMVHAPEHIEAKAAGGAIRVTLKGPDAFHNYGAGRGHVKRQVLPSGGELPDGVAEALSAAAGKVFDRVVGR